MNFLRSIFSREGRQCSRYPEYGWARTIAKVLHPHIDTQTLLIDGACGNGITSYWLGRRLALNPFLLIDVNPNSLEFAQRRTPRAQTICGDLHQEIARIDHIDQRSSVLLLINTLYEIRDATQLIHSAGNNIPMILGIFPFLEGENVKAYDRNFPNHKTRLNPLTYQETHDLFRKAGYHCVYEQEVSRIMHHKYVKTSQNGRFLLFCYIWLERLFLGKKGAYFLALFKKELP